MSDSYVPAMPADEWAKIRDDVLTVVRAGDPDDAKTEQAWLSDVTGLARWAYQRGFPRDPAQLLQPWLIETYVADPDNGWAGGTSRTIRGRLTKLSRRVLGSDAVPGYEVALAAPDPRAPYTDVEIDRIVGWSRFLNTEAQRHNVLAAMSLCVGAGLSANELASLRGADVVNDEDGAVIIVRGERQRQVPVTSQWSDVALHAASRVGNADFVFRPERIKVSRNTTNDFFHKMHAKSHGQVPLLSCQRLRATWIVGHLVRGCPIVTLAEGAGVRREALARYFVFLPDTGAANATLQLRAGPS